MPSNALERPGTVIEGLVTDSTKPRFLLYDTLDDRREIHYLLEKLPPSKRVEWLAWCCQCATVPNSTIRPQVSPRTSGKAIEIYFDFWALCSQYELDADDALAYLTDMVRGKSA